MARRGLDLREALRPGLPDEEIAAADRERPGGPGPTAAPKSEPRLPGRGVLYQLESLRADPRREMHTRGG